MTVAKRFAKISAMSSFEEVQQYRIHVALMLDFYGQLLPDRAREVLECYFFDDYSLTEIADLFQISRQAVHDRLHQGLNSLLNYEEKLGLVARSFKQKEMIRAVVDNLDKGHIAEAKDLLKQLDQML